MSAPSTSTPVVRPSGLVADIARVVESGNCAGCGFCATLDANLQMGADDRGFRRPVPVRLTTRLEADDAVARARFARACPGSTVQAQSPTSSTRHDTMGPVIEAWSAWAADEEIRHRGSSGGVLTALSVWLLETGLAANAVSARADHVDPRRTVSVEVRSAAEAVAAAGSRYAPVATLANPAIMSRSAVIAKPCEVSALRADLGAEAPILMSFFCAGTPSQRATDHLVEDLGAVEPDRLADLWYRGRGWPGRFTAVSRDGSVVDASYEESWGSHLGRDLQWRCKICPDGVGESSDITAADFWESDEQGYPLFGEAEGVSALIARTTRGAELVRAAIAAGVIVAQPLDIDALARIQPLQRGRRETLLGRLLGQRLAGLRGPHYRGFGLVRLATTRVRPLIRTLRGTYRRVKARGVS